MTPYFLQAHQAFCRTGGSQWLSLVHLRKQEKVKRSRVRWHPYASEGWRGAWCAALGPGSLRWGWPVPLRGGHSWGKPWPAGKWCSKGRGFGKNGKKCEPRGKGESVTK